MLKLVIFDLILAAIAGAAAYFCRKFVTKEKTKRILLIAAALSTIVCHYSSLLYHLIADGTAMGFLESNPNLLLPIYPCNVVMWCCLIFSFSEFNSKFSRFLADFIFLFGLFSALIGMFANVDFINDPTLGNYDVTKGIVAHAFMLLNVFLVPALGLYRLDLPKNLLHIAVSVVMMYIVGLYCNLVFRVIASESTAYSVNSMFILHSPFDDSKLLTYPTIAGAALILYFALLLLCEQIFHKKGGRWYDKHKK